MEDKEEYKVLVDNAITVQKTLNQWKHQFNIKILGFNATNELTSVLLTRYPKCK